MSIKSLESYLFEGGLVGSAPIESLNSITLGIDVDHYVSRLLNNKREQCLDAIGGFPSSLKIYIDSDLQMFQDNNVVPVFVFSGSAISNQQKYQSYETGEQASNYMDQGSTGQRTAYETIIAQRYRAWAHWSNLMNNNKVNYIDQPLFPGESFRYNNALNLKRFQSDLIQYFISKSINYMVAPFSSWIQLSYLLKEEYINAIYGPTDLLMVESVPKFILGMEFPNKEFRFIDRKRILSEFKLNVEDFLDICMAVGNDLQPFTLPPLQGYPQQQTFEIALDMSLNGGTNFYTYLLTNKMQVDTSKYITLYQKGLSALKYMPVLKSNGRVEIFGYNEAAIAMNDKDKAEIPNDIHEFIQQRLPHEYNFYRSIGLVSNNSLDIVSSGMYFEYPPLDGGSSDSYRELVRKSIDVFKNNEINLLTQPINRYYQIKPIKHVKWFSPTESVTLSNRVTPPIYDLIKHLYVKTGDVSKKFSISEFIKVITQSKDFVKDFTVESKKSGSIIGKLTAPFDLLATSFLRFLCLLGFFEYTSTLKPTEYGTVFLLFNELGLGKNFHQAFLTILVFFKLDVLRLGEETRPPTQSILSQVTLRSYPKESSYILVITRILTLFQLNQKPCNYYGPIDKKTLTFREHFDFINKNMSELFESILVNSLAFSEFDRLILDNTQWQREIVGHMPFKLSTPNTVMAMMWELYLQKWLHNGHDKDDALALVTNSFSNYKYIANLEDEMKRAYNYLNDFYKLFGKMNEFNLIATEDYELFQEAFNFVGMAINQTKILV